MSQIVTHPVASDRSGRYTHIAILLHWLIAVLLIGNVLLGLSADLWPDDWVRPAIDLHKSVGLTVLGLVLLRVLWRMSHPAPPFPAGYSPLEQSAAQVAHALLYVLMLLLPITGWMHDSAFEDAAAHPLRLFWMIPWFRIAAIQDLAPAPKELLHTRFFAWHVWAGYALYGLLALHIIGAFKHQFIDRQAELQRMGLGR